MLEIERKFKQQIQQIHSLEPERAARGTPLFQFVLAEQQWELEFRQRFKNVKIERKQVFAIEFSAELRARN